MSVTDFNAADEELIGFVRAFARAMIATDIKYSARLSSAGTDGVEQVFSDCANERGALYSVYLSPRQRTPSGCVSTPPMFEPVKSARFYISRRNKRAEITAESEYGKVDFLFVLMYGKETGWRINSLKSRFHGIDGARSWQYHSL